MKKLIVVLCFASIASLFVGVEALSLADIIRGEPRAWELLLTSRFPRLLAVLLAGSGLSIAGLIMQQVGQNRFASPSTTGTTECAVLGYVLSLVWFGQGNTLWLIFLVSMLGTVFFIYFIQSIQFKNAIFVPLIGIIFGNIVNALATFVAYKYDVIQDLSSWTVANFATILAGNYELLYLAVPVSIFAYMYATRISAVGMGKDFAVNLGLNYQQVILIGIMLVSIVASTVMMIVGQLQFLGLIVPNLVSYFYGDNLRQNIPRTAVYGGLLVLLCDVVGRVIIFPYEMPISMIMNIVGGFVFVFFVLKGRMHER